jgi:hypothetical protein
LISSHSLLRFFPKYADHNYERLLTPENQRRFRDAAGNSDESRVNEMTKEIRRIQETKEEG